MYIIHMHFACYTFNTTKYFWQNLKISVIHSSLADIPVYPGSTAFEGLEVQHVLISSNLIFLNIQLMLRSVLIVRCSAIDSLFCLLTEIKKSAQKLWGIWNAKISAFFSFAFCFVSLFNSLRPAFLFFTEAIETKYTFFFFLFFFSYSNFIQGCRGLRSFPHIRWLMRKSEGFYDWVLILWCNEATLCCFRNIKRP